MRLGWLVVAMGSAGTACTLLVDTSGLSSTDVAAADAAPLLDAAAPDGDASDGGAADAPLLDASADASFSCASSAATLCDDFDTAALGARWTGTKMAGATMMIDSAGPALSAPGALLVSLPDNPTQASRVARLEKSLPTLKAIDCRFALRVDSTSSTSTDDVAVLELDLTKAGFDAFFLRVAVARETISVIQTGDLAADAGAIYQEDLASSYVVGTWARVRLVTDFQTVTLAVDGVSTASIPVVLGGSPSSALLSFGEAQDSQRPRWSIRLDDLECFVTP